MKAENISGLIVETPSESIKVVRLARPRERNPLSVEVLTRLDEIFTLIERDAETRAVILTGTDDVFASGANLREIAALETEAEVRAFGQRGQNLMRKIAESNLFTVAAVNGFCMGGAFDLAMSCRVRLASPNAVFAHTGANLGIMTAWSGTQILPRIVGEAKALEIFLTAERISAADALKIGLVKYVHAEILPASVEFVQQILHTEK